MELPAPESENNSLPPSSFQDHAPDNINAMAHMAIRSPSPGSSEASSSADEVVFKGRLGSLPAPETAGSSQSQTIHYAASDPHSPNPSNAPPKDDLLAIPWPIAASTDYQAPSATAGGEARDSMELSIRVTATTHFNQSADSDADSVDQDQFVKRRQDKPAWEGTTTQWQHRSKPGVGWLSVNNRPDMDAFLPEHVNLHDAAMDDYIQNMDEFGVSGDIMATSTFSRREMDLDGGSHNDWESASRSQEEDEDEGQAKDTWDSDMIQDLADISTSSDVMDTVVRILAKRTRRSGIHYLCVYESSVADDARWLPSTFLNSPAEKQLIQVLEDDILFRNEQHGTSESTDEGDEEDDELDDETIARVLQKQEDLGLGSDEILLYARDDFFSGTLRTKAYSGDFGIPHKKRQARGRGQRGSTFPSASAMADALALDPYDGFDVMDTERPSLKPKKKGRRGQMPPEIDDFDLNEQLENAWEADRVKKRLKKAEREDLRQKGLLGRKGKAPNLKVKYRGGIAMQDVIEEIRDFLFGDLQTYVYCRLLTWLVLLTDSVSLALPPMDAHHRAIIHQTSRYFNLTSRSRGDGLNRFTVLSKTSRTRTWTDNEFDAIIQRKGFVKSLHGPLKNEDSARPSKGATFRYGGGRVRNHTGYRDGETVGANAPELGPENKGHALMMKMGWSNGMGLGALDNKGILQPIPHTVKTNKAGLQ